MWPRELKKFSESMVDMSKFRVKRKPGKGAQSSKEEIEVIEKAADHILSEARKSPEFKKLEHELLGEVLFTGKMSKEMEDKFTRFFENEISSQSKD